MSDKFLQDLEVMLFILVFIIIFVEILRVGGECKKKQEEEERKIKDKYLEKIKNLYKSKNNPRVDLIIEELEEKDIDFIKDYYFTILFKEEKK